jgi:hypothetical protein
MHPCGERLLAVIGVTFVVDCKQGLLNKVFNFIGQAGQAPHEERPQIPGQVREEFTISLGISVESPNQQVLQPFRTHTFTPIHLFVGRGFLVTAGSKNKVKV